MPLNHLNSPHICHLLSPNPSAYLINHPSAPVLAFRSLSLPPLSKNRPILSWISRKHSSFTRTSLTLHNTAGMHSPSFRFPDRSSDTCIQGTYCDMMPS